MAICNLFSLLGLMNSKVTKFSCFSCSAIDEVETAKELIDSLITGELETTLKVSSAGFTCLLTSDKDEEAIPVKLFTDGKKFSFVFFSRELSQIVLQSKINPESAQIPK